MIQNKYVLGFAFDPNFDYVVLINKVRPDWQKGRLNGVGGKKEDFDISYYDAMRREFKEETSVDINQERWQFFTQMLGDDFYCQCFSVQLTHAEFIDVSTTTDEEVKKVAICDIIYFKTISNIPWLIHMAADSLKHKHFSTIQYK